MRQVPRSMLPRALIQSLILDAGGLRGLGLLRPIAGGGGGGGAARRDLPALVSAVRLARMLRSVWHIAQPSPLCVLHTHAPRPWHLQARCEPLCDICIWRSPTLVECQGEPGVYGRRRRPCCRLDQERRHGSYTDVEAGYRNYAQGAVLFTHYTAPPTEVLTLAPTDAPTKLPTNAPMEVPTKAPT